MHCALTVKSNTKSGIDERGTIVAGKYNYVVMEMHSALDQICEGKRTRIPLVDKENGVIGVLLVCKTKKDAERFATSNAYVVKIQEVKTQCHGSHTSRHRSPTKTK